MTMFDLMRLLGLLLTALVAGGAVWLLLQLSRDNSPQPAAGGMPLGYPPEHFANRSLATDPGLAALAATQHRLVSVYRQLPPQSDLEVWLGAFLRELREIMDTAYRAAAVTQIYGRNAPLERVVAEVQQIEAEIVEQVTQRLLARDADPAQELLAGRLATLRLCVEQLR